MFCKFRNVCENLIFANICEFKVLSNKHLVPVVQNFLSLTRSLSSQFVNRYQLQKQIHCYFLLKKCKGFSCNAKDSHIFSTKNNNVFVRLPFEILTNRKLTTSLILNNWPLQALYSVCYCHANSRTQWYMKIHKIKVT